MINVYRTFPLLKASAKFLVIGLSGFCLLASGQAQAQSVTIDSVTHSARTPGNCADSGTTYDFTAHGTINNSSDSVTIQANYDDGNGLQNEGFTFDSGGVFQKNFNHTFNSPDTFAVKVVADITGASDTARDTVVIQSNCVNLTGTVYNDVDSNCQLSSPDLRLDNRKLVLANNMGNSLASDMADANGNYTFNVDTTGNPTYQVKLNDTGQFRHGCQTPTQSTSQPSTENLNFGLNAPNGNFAKGVVLASSVSGNCIKPNQPDTFELKVNANTTSPITYQIDYGDSGGYGSERKAFPDTFGNYDIRFIHTYDSIGTFNLKVYATNGNGSAELESLKVKVANNCQTITGRVFADTSQNCSYENGEDALSERNVILRNNNDSLLGFIPTDKNGRYTFSVDSSKQYKVVLKDTGSLTYGCSGNGVLAVNNPPASNVNFGLNCTGTDYGVGDASVQIGNFRIGQTRDLTFSIEGIASCNQDSLSCVTVVLDSGQFTADSLYPSNPSYPKFTGKSGDTVKYNMKQTVAGDFKDVTLPIFTKNTVSLSDTLCVTISLCTNNDLDSTNDQLTLCRNAVNSFDPNNKLVTPTGTDSLGFIQDSTQLTYTINFQNTGNAKANNVTIKDTLDKDLDPTTVNVTGSSDSYNLTVNQGRILTFDFPNIDLPDSATNLSGSKGYVTFTLSPKNDSSDPGTQYSNYADIIFDQNPPIRTDTALNTICPVIRDTIEPKSCNNYTYVPDDTTFFSSGVYFDTFKAANGCDSILVVDYTVLSDSFSSNIVNVSGCGSYTVPSGDTTYFTNQNNVTDTVPNSVGCDSIILLKVTITDEVADTIDPKVCDSFVSPSGDTTYTTSGTYKDTLTTSTGCDSIFTINLTIKPDITDTRSVTACNEYTVPSGDETYQQSGQYFDTIDVAGGCDTLLTINLTIENFVSSSISRTVCDSFTAPSGDTTYFTSGNYKDTLVRPGTCDSIVNIDLTVLQPKQSTINVSTCGTYTVPSGDETYSMGGTYNDTVIASNGCDSVITINLSFDQAVKRTIDPVACNSYTVPSGDDTFTNNGTYKDTVTSPSGCDTIYTINLTIRGEVTNTVSEVACNAFTVPSGDETYTSSGTYKDTIPSVNGCDSIITFNLTIGQDKQVTTSIKSCNSYTVPSGDETYTTDGTYNDTIPTANGCDSVLTINLSLGALDTSLSRAAGKRLVANAPNANYQWLICDSTGFKPIDGSTGKTFRAFKSTSYAVAIQQGNCQDTSACYSIQNVGFADGASERIIQIFPNPAHDELNVTLKESATRLTMVNLTGQRVLQRQGVGQGTNTLDVSGLSDGIYLIKLYTSDGVETKKVMIR